MKSHTNSDWSTIGASTYFGFPRLSQKALLVFLSLTVGRTPSTIADVESSLVSALILPPLAMLSFRAQVEVMEKEQRDLGKQTSLKACRRRVSSVRGRRMLRGELMFGSVEGALDVQCSID